MGIKIEYIKDWLDKLEYWGNKRYSPSLTNAQKILCNLEHLGGKDRYEWMRNIDVISGSIPPYTFNDITWIKIEKIKLLDNYLVLQTSIHISDASIFECEYIISDTLNLHGTFYSNFIANKTYNEDDDCASDENVSATMSSSTISSTLSDVDSDLEIDDDDVISDLESSDEEPLSVTSTNDNAERAAATAEDDDSDLDASAEAELLAIQLNGQAEDPDEHDSNVERPSSPFINSLENNFANATRWQPGIFHRPFSAQIVASVSRKGSDSTISIKKW